MGEGTGKVSVCITYIDRSRRNELRDYLGLSRTSFDAWWKSSVSEWLNKGQYRGEPFPSLEEEYRLWYKWYKQK